MRGNLFPRSLVRLLAAASCAPPAVARAAPRDSAIGGDDETRLVDREAVASDVATVPNLSPEPYDSPPPLNNASAPAPAAEAGVIPLQKRLTGLEVLYVAGALVGIFSFVVTWTVEAIKQGTKEKPPPPGTSFVLAAAIQPPWERRSFFRTENPDCAGDFPAVTVYNVYGAKIGSSRDEGPYIKSGTIGLKRVEHQGQGAYSVFGAVDKGIDKDAPARDEAYLDGTKYADHLAKTDQEVCIAFGGSNMDPERGGLKYMFTGDIGWFCGAPWYFSGMFVSEDHVYQPRCFWLGRHGSHLPTGFQIHWPAFSKKRVEKLDDPRVVCNSVDFALRYEPSPKDLNLERTKPIIYVESWVTSIEEKLASMDALRNQTHHDDTKPSRPDPQQPGHEQEKKTTQSGPGDAGQEHHGTNGKRQSGSTRQPGSIPRPAWLDEELVVDGLDQSLNSAVELCSDSRSFGPDYANTREKRFCHMGSKTLYKFCDEEDLTEEPCFDTVKKVLVTRQPEGPDFAPVRRRAVREPYKHVRHWR